METNIDPQLATSKVYMKCPTCSNPYSVDPLDISTSQPTFHCLACETKFFFHWPQPFHDREVSTFAQQGASIPEEMAEAAQPVLEASPAEEPAEVSRPEPPPQPAAAVRAPVRTGDELDLALQEKWSALQNHWDDEMWHQSFLSFCDKKARLSFASGRYAQFLKDQPKDVIARKMRERIKSLSRSDLIKAHRAVSSPQAPRSENKVLSVLKWWWPISLVTCATLFMIGYSQPIYRNLIGLSVALLVFTAGVKFLFLSDKK